jgi:hypothetical protein
MPRGEGLHSYPRNNFTHIFVLRPIYAVWEHYIHNRVRNARNVVSL